MQVHQQIQITSESTYEIIPEVESNTCTTKKHEDKLSKKGVDIGYFFLLACSRKK
jgi:hypothetical protein